MRGGATLTLPMSVADRPTQLATKTPS